MRRCYVVSKEVTAMFTAEDGEDLAAAAEHALREEARNSFPDSYSRFDIRTQLATDLADGWDHDCLVYGSHEGDLRADDALKLNVSKEASDGGGGNA
jgi:hypothetical protein